MNIFGNRSQVSINGRIYTGNNISINGNNVIIDGNVQSEELNNKKIEIAILCNVDKITCEESIIVKGNITGNVEAGTSVSCGNIKGDVSAGSSVNCDDINGNVMAGSSINCDDISGNATARIINR